MMLDQALKAHPDTETLVVASAKDEAFQKLLQSFNDLIENKEIVCSVNPHKLNDETTVGELKVEMSKLDTEEQIDLIAAYVKERKKMNSHEDKDAQDDKRLKWWVTKRLMDMASSLFTVMCWILLIITGVFTYGYFKNGTLEKDVLFKIIDSVIDVLKFFIGSANK